MKSSYHPSIHPSTCSAYPWPGYGGSCLSRDTQTSLSLDTSSRNTSWGRHPGEPCQLAPLDVEEQRLYSELLPGKRASHPISMGAPWHPAEETHFGHLYPGSYSFSRVLSPSPQSTCGLVKPAPMNPRAPCGVFHSQNENRIVPPKSSYQVVLF